MIDYLFILIYIIIPWTFFLNHIEEYVEINCSPRISKKDHSMITYSLQKKTDKDTIHSYLRVYHSIFHCKKESAKNVLEIGIFDGGSLWIWYNYFNQAHIYGIDISPISRFWDKIKRINRIHLFPEQNAYNRTFTQKEFRDKNIKFDIIIDDGPHTLQSMKDAINLYLPLLSPKGIFIIEDLQSINWFDELKKITPKEYHKYVISYDLRKTKNRFDDIIFCINTDIS